MNDKLLQRCLAKIDSITTEELDNALRRHGFEFDIKEEAKLDTKATIVKALKQAYNLGQTYWAQADSDYSSQWKKADATETKFDALVKEIEQLLEEKI